MKYKGIKRFCLKENSIIRKCMEVIDKNKQGIALVVNEQGQLKGTVSDGDIRRFILAGHSIEERVTKVMSTNPITAPLGTPEKKIKELLNNYLERNIPILDENGCPCNLVNIRDFVSEEYVDQIAVIMAGGEGKRLKPLTEDVPKPMIKVGDKPILENIIDNFVKFGILNIYISINYKANVIKDYFGDGSKHGVKITYIKEKNELGTAGALTLLPDIPLKPCVVINGDVITKTNFLRLSEFHNQHRCVMTVAAIQYKFNIPYGVLNLSGHYLLGIEEKPQRKILCNAGIYMLNPEVLSLIPKDSKFDMTDLIKEIVRKGLPIATFPIHEYWIDIGEFEELKKANKVIQQDIKKGKGKRG